jgi:hypothetical protein
MSMGYLRMWTGLRCPVLVPHEFQWHFQAAVGMAAAVGAGGIGVWIQKRGLGLRRRLHLPAWLVMAGLIGLTIGGALPEAAAARSRNWKAIPEDERQDVREAVQWIKQSTSINDVFLGSEPTDFFLVAGLTGRKLVCPPAGHANVAVAADQRMRDRDRMFVTTNPEEFYDLLRRYGVRYILLECGQEGLQNRWEAWHAVRSVFRSKGGWVMILAVGGGEQEDGLGPPHPEAGTKAAAL